MNHTLITLRSGYDGHSCLVHARFCQAPWGLVATCQPLDVKGSDLFSGLLAAESRDGGRTWSPFAPQSGLSAVTLSDGDRVVPCDATPLFHKPTNTVLLLGATAGYTPDALAPSGRHSRVFYSTRRETDAAFSPMRFLEMPESLQALGCRNGCGQSLVLNDGTLLVPVYFKAKTEGCLAAAVLHCSFDGETLSFIKMGDTLTVPSPRGLYEPSVIHWGNKYLLTLRNDDYGYVTSGPDGLHYAAPVLWCWDDGKILPNYNTQQHWMPLGDKLYLVYTRRAGTNDHVFRHRAPLFAAEVDPERLCLIRKSEFIVIPERGARLGNFGVCTLGPNKAGVMAAEWMQPLGCEAYGSDNSIFLAVLEAE